MLRRRQGTASLSKGNKTWQNQRKQIIVRNHLLFCKLGQKEVSSLTETVIADLVNARELLAKDGYTCVLCKGERLYTSRERGVKPLLAWWTSGVELHGFAAADKVVGKAAALLYVLLGVSHIHAGVVSLAALQVLERHAISVTYDTQVPAIRNRTDTGFCPMERAVWHCEEPEEAVALLRRKIAELQNRK